MDNRARMIAKGMIMGHVEFCERPYRDALGFWVVGYDHCMEFRPVSRDAAAVILDDDIDWFFGALEKSAPSFKTLDSVRQAALVDMTASMGLLGIMKMKPLWRAIEDRDWERASDAILESAWLQQAGQRAHDCANAMKTGRVREPELDRGIADAQVQPEIN